MREKKALEAANKELNEPLPNNNEVVVEQDSQSL